MDEREYEQQANETFGRVMDLFEDVDPDQADVEQAGDVITIELMGRGKLVLNTQRPARQIWLAGGQRAWHFSLDPVSRQWRDDKQSESELFAVLSDLCRQAGISLPASA